MDTTNILITLLLIIPVIHSLRDVRVKIPSAVRKSDTVVLNCYYDMEGDSLYSVKWYKGRREFYRYSPKENPAMKTFPIAGVHVMQSASNESQLTLSSVTPATTGKFSCEVSADFPSFHTMIVSGDMEVVEVPHQSPQILGIRARYKPGDIIRGNCTAKYSRPAANLTWTINDVPVYPPITKPHKPQKNHKNELETSTLGLHFVVNSQHFINGRLKVKCISRVHDVYQQSNERFIEEERPRVTSLASSNHNHNIGLSYNSYNPDDNEIDDKDTYLDNIKDFLFSFRTGDASSLNAGSLQTCHSSLVILTISTSLLLFNYLFKFNYALGRLNSS
ncbi:hypothetical protein ACKWTF_001318 [Chironomus riparius]